MYFVLLTEWNPLKYDILCDFSTRQAEDVLKRAESHRCETHHACDIGTFFKVSRRESFQKNLNGVIDFSQENF